MHPSYANRYSNVTFKRISKNGKVFIVNKQLIKNVAIYFTKMKFTSTLLQ